MDRIADAVKRWVRIVGGVCGCSCSDGVKGRLETVETEVAVRVRCSVARRAGGIHGANEQRSAGEWLAGIVYDLPANRSGRITRNLCRRRRLHLRVNSSTRQHNSEKN